MTPLEIKLMVTGFIFFIGIAVCFIDMKKEKALPDYMWRLGHDDPMKNLSYKENGSPRKYLKHSILILLAICIGVIWVFF
ncbi:MAG: hypothetical protein HY811_05165 [Planctomycetes bacterium]|nr:hypothetical protein [Planctomycetota bacterium]